MSLSFNILFSYSLAEELKEQQPEKEVLLTVFGSDVLVKGGGRDDNLPHFGSLENKTFEELLEIGLQLSNDYPLKPIAESHE